MTPILIRNRKYGKLVVCHEDVILFRFPLSNLISSSIPLILGLLMRGTTYFLLYFHYFFILYFDFPCKVGWRGELEFDVFSLLLRLPSFS